MKLSKVSRRLIDALIRAAANPKTNVDSSRAALERHVLQLESTIAQNALAKYTHAVRTAKERRMARSALQEQRDANIVLISRGKK